MSFIKKFAFAFKFYYLIIFNEQQWISLTHNDVKSSIRWKQFFGPREENKQPHAFFYTSLMLSEDCRHKEGNEIKMKRWTGRIYNFIYIDSISLYGKNVPLHMIRTGDEWVSERIKAFLSLLKTIQINDNHVVAYN